MVRFLCLLFLVTSVIETAFRGFSFRALLKSIRGSLRNGYSKKGFIVYSFKMLRNRNCGFLKVSCGDKMQELDVGMSNLMSICL